MNVKNFNSYITRWRYLVINLRISILLFSTLLYRVLVFLSQVIICILYPLLFAPYNSVLIFIPNFPFCHSFYYEWNHSWIFHIMSDYSGSSAASSIFLPVNYVAQYFIITHRISSFNLQYSSITANVLILFFLFSRIVHDSYSMFHI